MSNYFKFKYSFFLGFHLYQITICNNPNFTEEFLMESDGLGPITSHPWAFSFNYLFLSLPVVNFTTPGNISTS